MTVASPPIKLIATDLDGTFLGADSEPIQANMDAVRLAHKLGVRIVFATGRPARWLQRLDPLADIHPDVMASNGAVLYDVAQHKVRKAYPLPRDATLAVMADVAATIPLATFAVEYSDGWGRMPAYPPRGDFVEANVITTSHEQLLDARQPVKLLIMHPDVPTEQLAVLAEPLVAGRLDLTISLIRAAGLLELTAPGVTKGSVLQDLLQAYGVSPSDVAAFGDMPNDISMLEVAGHPFAMANSHPAVLERGYPLAGRNDEGGFARAVMALLQGAG